MRRVTMTLIRNVRTALSAAVLFALTVAVPGLSLVSAAPLAQGDNGEMPMEMPMENPPALGPTPVPGVNRDAFVQEVLKLVNAERARTGAAPMTLNDQLGKAAQDYAELMSRTGCFDHECPPVTDFGERAKNAGYTGGFLGENIAMGQQTPAQVMTGWMESPGHRENILNATYKELGVGVFNGGNGDFYWVQVFGSN